MVDRILVAGCGSLTRLRPEKEMMMTERTLAR